MHAASIRPPQEILKTMLDSTQPGLYVFEERKCFTIEYLLFEIVLNYIYVYCALPLRNS